MARVVSLFYVDAFTHRLYGGNPAAVCLLSHWLNDNTLQNIAAEINFSETAFLVKRQQDFELRWFSPVKEVDLCGHATLASAHVLYRHLNYVQEHVSFYTKSGVLRVELDGEFFRLDLPRKEPQTCAVPAILSKALGAMPLDVLRTDDYLVLLESEDLLMQIKPDFDLLTTLDCRGIIATAHSDTVDFVIRFFSPSLGVNEDPVTGSALCTLAPYWAGRLGKTHLSSRQLSKRGGYLMCDLTDDRVLITGQAVTFMAGQLYI
jgi:PhzF family phenazine biosynthesis protein